MQRSAATTMSAGATTERVLATLRQMLASREFHPGTRLDPAHLAQRLTSSLTPVREALLRLTGEDLVESRSGGGFTLPHLDASTLTDCYAWSGQVLAIALHNWPRRRKGQSAMPAIAPGTIAERCGALFGYIGRLSCNAEHARAILRLNARLHLVRLVEGDVLEGLEEEFDDLHQKTVAGNRRHLLNSCANYHRRRVKHVNAIVRSLHESA